MRALSPRPIHGSEAVADADLELEQLYRSYAQTLAGRLRRRFGAETAEDIVQEAFLRLRRYGRDDPVRSPKALLTRIAVNLGLDAVRAEPPSPPLELEALAGLPEGAVACEQDEALQLKQIILQLPKPLQDVFILQRFAGMTYAQIAEHCGVSVKTVEWRMSKAMAFCTARLRD
jgi:RNA polymerase sigma-70 factor (ECF subfamily)